MPDTDVPTKGALFPLHLFCLLKRKQFLQNSWGLVFQPFCPSEKSKNCCPHWEGALLVLVGRTRFSKIRRWPKFPRGRAPSYANLLASTNSWRVTDISSAFLATSRPSTRDTTPLTVLARISRRISESYMPATNTSRIAWSVSHYC